MPFHNASLKLILLTGFIFKELLLLLGYYRCFISQRAMPGSENSIMVFKFFIKLTFGNDKNLVKIYLLFFILIEFLLPGMEIFVFEVYYI
jgi:hypothetical protein